MGQDWLLTVRIQSDPAWGYCQTMAPPPTMNVSTTTETSEIWTLAPAGVLGLSKARSKGTSVHKAVGCISSARRFADHELVECHSGRSDLEDGALGPGARRRPEEIVTGGVFPITLCGECELGMVTASWSGWLCLRL